MNYSEEMPGGAENIEENLWEKLKKKKKVETNKYVWMCGVVHENENVYAI